MSSAPFHDGQPSIIEINAIGNDRLAKCHDEYRKYLTTRHGEEPTIRELYHGTNNNILDTLYTHGLQPPSDTNASDACPVSGKKGLSTPYGTTQVEQVPHVRLGDLPRGHGAEVAPLLLSARSVCRSEALPYDNLLGIGKGI